MHHTQFIHLNAPTQQRNHFRDSPRSSQNALPTTEADECTFKPDIGSNKHKPLEEKTSEEFFERLYKEHSAILKRKEDRTANAEKVRMDRSN